MFLFGFLLIFLASGFFVYDYTEKIKARKNEYSGILSLLVHIRSSLSVSVKPIGKILSDFDCKELSKSGLLSLFKSDTEGGKEDCADSYKYKDMPNAESDNIFRREKLISLNLSIDDFDRDKLIDFFNSFGKSTLSEEEKRINAVIGHFESREKAVSSSSEKDIKVAWLLFACVFIGLFILFI